MSADDDEEARYQARWTQSGPSSVPSGSLGTYYNTQRDEAERNTPPSTLIHNFGGTDGCVPSLGSGSPTRSGGGRVGKGGFTNSPVTPVETEEEKQAKLADRDRRREKFLARQADQIMQRHWVLAAQQEVHNREYAERVSKGEDAGGSASPVSLLKKTLNTGFGISTLVRVGDQLFPISDVEKKKAEILTVWDRDLEDFANGAVRSVNKGYAKTFDIFYEHRGFASPLRVAAGQPLWVVDVNADEGTWIRAEEIKSNVHQVEIQFSPSTPLGKVLFVRENPGYEPVLSIKMEKGFSFVADDLLANGSIPGTARRVADFVLRKISAASKPSRDPA